MRFRPTKYKWFLVILGAFLLVIPFSLLHYLRDAEEIKVSKVGPQYDLKSCQPISTELYFNNEPGSPVFSDLIVKEIDKAKRTLDIAMYSLKSEPIKAAIYRAYDRGVKVTLVLDYRKKEIHDEFLSDLPAGISRLNLGSFWPGSMLMHHKFALIDKDEETAKLLFGSFNWTEAQDKYDRSFLMFASDKDLIASFSREFFRLSSGVSGRDKLESEDYFPWDLLLSCSNAGNYNKGAHSRYEVWFSPGRPEENIKKRMIKMIEGANEYIKVMAWSFTDKSLANELLSKARVGVKVTVIIDGFNFYNESSVGSFLVSESTRPDLDNLVIATDPKILSEDETIIGPEPPNPFLHHHAMIIDGREAVFGTNNWSVSGTFYNDESAIVTDSKELIDGLERSFDYNLSLGQIIE